MKYEDFMIGTEDQMARQVMWSNFIDAEKESKRFLGDWNYPEIKHVYLDRGGKAEWSENGFIKLPSADSMDSLYHEIFHSVLHNSPFTNRMRTGKTEFYCECLCHSFQYFMEMKLHKPNGLSWANRMRTWKNIECKDEEKINYERILSRASDNNPWDLQNGLATHAIITLSNNSIENFISLFKTMNQ